MGGQRVTLKDPWVVGGEGTVADLFPLNPIAAIALRWLGQIVRHPVALMGVAVWVWLWIQYDLGILLMLIVSVGIVVSWLLVTGFIRTLCGWGFTGPVDFLLGVYRIWIVRTRWRSALWAGAFNERRQRDVPNIWFLHVTKRGIRGWVNSGRSGLPIKDISQAFDNINARMGSWRVRVESTDPGKGWVEIMWKDPLVRVVSPSALDDSSVRMGLVPFALDEDGNTVGLRPDRSLLVVGESGSGKSSVVWSLIRGLKTRKTPFKLHVIDPKGGAEMSELEHYEHTAQYAKDSTSAKDVVESVKKGMFARLEKQEGRKAVITDANPLQVLVIDELLLIKTLMKNDVESPLGQLLTQGRAAGYVVWACTQLGQKDVVGPLRGLFVQRVCLAVRSASLTDAVLGDGAEASGAKCSAISMDTPGIGFMYTEGARDYLRFRAAYIDDDMVKYITEGSPIDLDSRMRLPSGGSSSSSTISEVTRDY